jgi:PIN domain nuclease of toxin-antitoxin system
VEPRILLDTHVLVRALTDHKRLSREQKRILDESVRRNEPVAVSASSLLELAILFSADVPRIKGDIHALFAVVGENPMFRILPLTVEVAAEVFAIGNCLKDPSDRAIVATARVHRLRLLTSDERIIESQLVPVVE